MTAPDAVTAEPVRKKKPSPSREASNKQGQKIAENRPPEPIPAPAAAAEPAKADVQPPASYAEPASRASRTSRAEGAAQGDDSGRNRNHRAARLRPSAAPKTSPEIRLPPRSISRWWWTASQSPSAARACRARSSKPSRPAACKGVAQLAVQLTKLHTSDGQDISLSTEKFAKEGPTSKGDDAKKVGIGAALGAAIGAIAGGGKGAAIGAGAGGAAGAGTVAATRGKEVELPVETRLTFKIQEPVTVTERIR